MFGFHTDYRTSEKGHFPGYLCTLSVIITVVTLQAAFFFLKRVIFKVGEHAFCFPHLVFPPSPPNYWFCRKGYKHDQLKLKYAPVMANTGLDLDQYTDHTSRQHELEELKLMF